METGESNSLVGAAVAKELAYLRDQAVRFELDGKHGEADYYVARIGELVTEAHALGLRGLSPLDKGDSP